MPSYYQILGVARDATPDAIRKAYRARARERHPDMAAGGADQMVALNQAYEVLKDPATRAAYDRTLTVPAGRRLPQRPPAPAPSTDPYTFLTRVFQPVDQAVVSGIARLGGAIDELAYDLFDDGALAAFERAYQAVRGALKEADRKLWASEWPGSWNSHVNLYMQGMRQVEDALEDFETFSLNFDSDLLVEGREILAGALELLADAREHLLGHL